MLKNNSLLRVHIVASGPRCGTTLMAEAMRTCFDIDFASEHEDRLFSRPSRHCRNHLSKWPSDLFVLSPSLHLDPHFFVICLVRDPRDMIVSRHRGGGDQYYCTLRYWQTLVPYIKAFAKHPRFLLLKYEDFVAKPDHVQQEIARKIPKLTLQHPFSEYHMHGQVSAASEKALSGVRPIAPNGIGSWRQHLPRIKQQLALHGDIAEDLIHFGYETDREWLHALDDVSFLQSDSYWPEFFTHEEIRQRRKGRYQEAAKRALEVLWGRRFLWR